MEGEIVIISIEINEACTRCVFVRDRPGNL
jgi:hypothetical protein